MGAAVVKAAPAAVSDSACASSSAGGSGSGSVDDAAVHAVGASVGAVNAAGVRVATANLRQIQSLLRQLNTHATSPTVVSQWTSPKRGGKSGSTNTTSVKLTATVTGQTATSGEGARRTCAV